MVSASSVGGPTKGGPQPRVSSPLPGVSTLITRAPRSASIMAACGPAKARVKSTTTISASGPPFTMLLRIETGVEQGPLLDLDVDLLDLGERFERTLDGKLAADAA